MKVQIMAIGNVTPDSFYAASRLPGEDEVAAWARTAKADGADILDIGGCSTRPGSIPASEEDEWSRIEPALTVLRSVLPEATLSLDTFRPEIARRAMHRFGPMIINDISGGCKAMYSVAEEYGAPYVWTLRGDLSLPDRHPELLRLNLILDPGFGFIGSTEKDYDCLRRMDELRTYNRSILAGLSRKSMVYKPLGLTPDNCLAATQVLQLYALEHGATILRTHDVRATAQTIKLFELCNC